MLQLLLDFDDVKLLKWYLFKSCENESHPKLYLFGPKLHACIVRYGYAQLAPAFHALLKRWGRMSYADAVHLPFVLLASLAGVSDDPICLSMTDSDARQHLQAAYTVLRASCNVEEIMNVPCEDGDVDHQATDAALQLLKSCLLLEAYFGNAESLPSSILSHLPDLESWTDFPCMYVLAPAVAFAAHHNPHVALGAFSVHAVAKRVRGDFDHSMSPLAMAGSFLLRLLESPRGATLLSDILDMLGDTDGMCTNMPLICGICVLSKFIAIPIEQVTYLSDHVARATKCFVAQRDLDGILPYYCDGPVPATRSARIHLAWRYIIADALSFFNRAAPHHVGMLFEKLRGQLDGDDDYEENIKFPADVVAVMLPLLETFHVRWPNLDVGVRAGMAKSLHTALQGRARADSAVLAALSRLADRSA
ncbi:hypothetical protein SDRG_04676 [Saprolegnia diclina VS20]|uniref:Uncharacterized protein n=1 Tax=Saprolegnia diclina (strain VS20) TaxID=1156394 RepID=T0QW25_SAPDV|nr:hypothetical protein SDRG_04676 [Saprolegnia diclina VS20]EQC38250.1 hypothetical protein SDRG_04676 [Saprolegnia diclina VS20]|eukprot:XP_008608577.1 hypothetical protein SDRG_04676 [Saprolegnia diclina VS20]